MKKESVMDIRESYYKFHKFLLKLRLSLSLISESAWTTGSHNLWESLITDTPKFHLGFSQKK